MRRCTILILLMVLGTVDAAAPVAPAAVSSAGGGRTDQTGGQPFAGNRKPPPSRLSVAAPNLSEDFYPCTNCHAEMPPDLRRRALRDEHDNISLQHAAGQFWCLDCHHPENRDLLRLTSGESLPFTESHRLCGQCHGRQLLAWHAGLHGKRTGHWNGDKVSLLCTHCHDPHTPKFKALQPMPPPERSGRTGG